jgi:hypothetical protein
MPFANPRGGDGGAARASEKKNPGWPGFSGHRLAPEITLSRRAASNALH